jgi:heptosyltransferase-1
MRLYAPAGDVAWWAERRASLIGSAATYAVLAPTSRWASKRWPAPCWSALAVALRRRGFERLVLIGAPGERDQVETIAAGEGTVDLVGRVTVGQTMAVIGGAGLVVANDSAPLHMAVGFARPCVGLFGPTDPARVGPYGRPDAVVRAANPTGRVNFKDRRLGDALMRLIEPAAVLERIDSMTGAAGRMPAPQVASRRAQPAGEAVP